jgi:hypothetical protein
MLCGVPQGLPRYELAHQEALAHLFGILIGSTGTLAQRRWFTRVVEDLEDVIVLEARNRSRLTSETSTTLCLLRQKWMEHLDRDVALQTLVSTAVNDAHAALADLFDNAVMHELPAEQRVTCRLSPAWRAIAIGEFHGGGHRSVIS